MLARAGAHVTLIERPAHVDVWRHDGLFLDSVNFQESIRVAASTEIAASRDADLVLFSVKRAWTPRRRRASWRPMCAATRWWSAFRTASTTLSGCGLLRRWIRSQP